MKKIILLIVVGLTLIPLLKPGLFDVHDPTSAFRLYTLVETLKDGQIPAAWSNLLNFGYGYPLHLFYAPLFNYLSAAFFPLLGSYELAIKIALVSSSVLGAVGVYKLGRGFGSLSAMLSAIAFTFLPYRASALYVRGSYGEFLAMSLLPWVIYYWQKPLSNKSNLLITSIITSLFVLSHNTLLIIFLPILLLLVWLYHRKDLKNVMITLLFIFGLTAWFTLPVFFERNLVQVDLIARQTNFQDHFVTFSQLWYSRWGYGGSSLGVNGDQMSFMLGKGQIILGILGLIILFIRRKYLALITFGTITIFSIFLSTSISRFVWDQIPFLAVMQFPWRSLALAGVGLALLSGSAIMILPKNYHLLVTLILGIFLISTNLNYFRPQEYRNYNFDILSSQSNLDPLVKNKIPEYLPAWMPKPLERSNDELTRTSTRVFGTIIKNNTEPLIISTAYMPQWEMRLNGLHQPIQPSQDGLIMTQNDVKSGENQVELVWHRTFIESLGIWLTTISVFAVIGLWVL